MCTDHYNLKYLLDQRLSTIPQHAWVSKLFGFQFSVEFKPGRLNVVAGALSRRDEEHPSVHALSSPDFEFYEQFHQEAASLPKIVAAREEILANRATKEWRLIDDMVVYAGRLLLPETSSFWTQALEHAHGMGHEGVQKTLQRLCASFFTPRDTTLVREYIWGVLCLPAQQNGELAPSRPPPPAGRPKLDLDGHRHGLRGRLSQGRWQVRHPHRRRSAIQVHTHRAARTPIFGYLRCQV
jgi:hypothetical protein